MSLNRCEQRVFDYIQSQVDEGHFWKEKVQKISRAAGLDQFTAAVQLEAELWHYYKERAAVVAAFRDAVRTEGLQRMSMRNLADFLLRLWTEPQPRKTPTGQAV